MVVEWSQGSPRRYAWKEGRLVLVGQERQPRLLGPEEAWAWVESLRARG